VNEEGPANSYGWHHRPPGGDPVAVTMEESERMLLKRVANQKDDPRQAVWELSQFCRLNGRHDWALALREGRG